MYTDRNKHRMEQSFSQRPCHTFQDMSEYVMR